MVAAPPPVPLDSQIPGLRDRVRAHAHERAMALEAADALQAPPAPDPDPDFLRRIVMEAPELHALYCEEYERRFQALRALREQTPLIGLRPVLRLQIADLLALIAHVYGIPRRELVERGFNRYRHHSLLIREVAPVSARPPLQPKTFREEPPGLIQTERERFAPVFAAMDDLCARGFLPPGPIILAFDA